MTILDMSDLFCLSTTLPITPHTKCTTSKQTSDVIKRLHSKIPMTILVKKGFIWNQVTWCSSASTCVVIGKWK